MSSTPGQHQLSGGTLVSISTPHFSSDTLVVCRGGYCFAMKSEVLDLAYLVHGWDQDDVDKWTSLPTVRTIPHSTLFDMPLDESKYEGRVFDYLKTPWISITDCDGNLFGKPTKYFAQEVQQLEVADLPLYGQEMAEDNTAPDDWPVVAEWKQNRYLSGLEDERDDSDSDDNLFGGWCF